MVTNVELDHHSRWSLARRAARRVRRVLRRRLRGLALPARRRASIGRRRRRSGSLRFDADAPGPRRSTLRVPGRHNVLNARAALAALELAGFERRRGRAPALASFPGMLRRLAAQGQPRGRRDLRRLRPPSDRGRGDPRGAARARAAAADRGLPAAPVLAHQGARRPLRRRARGRRRGRRARRLPGPRAAGRASSPGSAGSTSPARPPTTRAGVRCCGSPTPTTRSACSARGSARATCW